MNETPSFPSGPDLQILIRRHDTAGRKQLVFEMHAQDPAIDLHFKEFPPVSLEMDPEYSRQELGRNLDQLATLAKDDAASQKIAEQRLAGIGTALFRKLPPELQERLWTLQGEIETIQILSDEPYLPWELLKLQRRSQGAWESGPFLCEAFSVTRWFRGLAQPFLAFSVQDLALVVSRDSRLPGVSGERDDIRALAGAERRVVEVPPDYTNLVQALSGGDFDAWHFSGHGLSQAGDADRAALEIDGDQPLRAEDLTEHGASLSRLHPLVFLNGCNTGQVGFSLTSLGGWARQFLDAGAGAFLGTLWEVRDTLARAFAQAFYRHFLGGEPIGEAVRQARREIRAQFPGNPSWLTYTLYAHPAAVCSTAPGKRVPWDAAGYRLTAVGSAPRPSSLHIPELEWRPEVSTPGALLRAEYGIVPFHGREKEKQDLYAWCTESPPVRVRLYTGPGGMGKTRLALEIAKDLRREGWRAGFLGSEAVRNPEEAWKALARAGGKVLAIVDYAETRRELLIPLLRHLYATDVGPIRLILLARSALDWWEQLKAEDQGVGELLSGPATSRYSLQGLVFTPQERAESYHLAGRSFGERLGKAPPAEAPDNLEADYFERILLLHMAAHVTVEGKEKAKGQDGILDELLRHEWRYWKRRVVEDKKLAKSLVPGIGRAVAVITLGGGVSGETEAVEVLRRLEAFAGHTGDVLLEVAHLLHECYPGDRWIEPILPDLLGEHLVQREMERGADELLDLVLGPAVG